MTVSAASSLFVPLCRQVVCSLPRALFASSQSNRHSFVAFCVYSNVNIPINSHMDETELDTYEKLLSGIKSCSGNDGKYRTAIDKLADVTDDQWLQLIIACSHKPFQSIIYAACNIIEDKIKWKNLSNGVVQLCEKWKTAPDLGALQKQDDYDQREFWSSVSRMGSQVYNKTKDLPAGKRAGQIVCDLVILMFKKRSRWLATLLENLYQLADFANIDAKRGEEFANAQLDLYVHAKTADWFEKEEHKAIAYVDNWIFEFHGTTNCMNSTSKGTPSNESARVVQAVWKLWDFLNRKRDEDITHDDGSRNQFGNAIYQIVYRFLLRFANTKEAANLKPFVAHCQSWTERNPDDMNESLAQIREGCEYVMTALMNNAPQVVGDSSETMLQRFFKKKDNSILSSISQAYETNQETRTAVHANIGGIVKVLGHDSSLDYQILSLLHQVAKREPLLLEKYIDKIENYVTDAHQFSQSLMILGLIANAKPTLFKGRGNNYFTSENTAVASMQLFLPIAQISDSEAERMIKLMEKEIQKEMKTGGVAGTMSNSLTILSQWTILAQTRKPPLEKHRKFISELLNDPKLRQSAQHLLDVLDGRSLETVANAVDKHDDDIDRIDGRVKKNAGDIGRIDKTVDEQGNRIAMNTTFTKHSKIRMDRIEGRVDNAEEHIDDLDSRTVSNAPVWAKEVSKLLNPRSDNDWRLVAKRIGYSNDDIRGWASQPDPCMSMLAEFYTSNKTSDATHFLLNVCKDIHRPDVVAVIEKHNKDVHDVVSDTAEVRTKPPPVFLSYQWDHQKQVKALKSSLQRQGFDCWLDIGQMGGGDNLYKEIDKGIRGCRVVVLCVTNKYTQSANCQREVNLCNGLGKKMIPILLEKTDWPPVGSMGPILADKLYIPFYQTQKSKDEPWPPEKFNELVAQIRQVVRPDRAAKSASLKHSASTSELKQRLTERKPKRRVSFADDVIDKDDEESERQTDSPVDLDNRSRPSFNVIISCSPDKLYEMRNLERNITTLGYTTKVMPYTENSVARVDSDVVIVALSQRYIKSSMGGKEVTKTLQSGRALIPLVLDNVTYPTPELKDQSKVKPVDCRKMKARASWDDSPELEEVVDRLQSLMPHINGVTHHVTRRDKRSSPVPLGNNPVRTVMHRRVPSDPLAREASEITIRVRPPTPEVHERSRIPRHVSHSRTLHPDEDDSVDEVNDNVLESDNDDDDDDDDDGGNSTDSEAQAAKNMQHGYKLPPVTTPVRAVPFTRQQQPSVSASPPGRPAQQQQSQRPAPRQPTPMRRSGPPSPSPRRTYNWDNKLPSVYRQKRIASSSLY